MEYKVSCALKPGFNKISSIGDGELKLTEFAIINLADKQRFAANTGGFDKRSAATDTAATATGERSCVTG